MLFRVTEFGVSQKVTLRVFGVLQCNICTIQLPVGTIGIEIGANGKNGDTIGTNYGTNVTNQWYHWENPEHTLYDIPCGSDQLA